MKRFAPTTWAVLACGLAAAITAPSALAARTLCVGGKHACYSTIQAAIDAAHDGDTVVIAPGSYAGGVTIDVSVAIVGAGARSTKIQGGGPVLTIGVGGAPTQPTVSITGVTITGGVTTSAPTPDGPITFVAAGGGDFIHGPASPDRVGAVVTIRNSVITGNRATPSSTIGGEASCPSDGNCPFAQGVGGGIADNGQLTLINTTVSNNLAGGPLASNAAGGGIWTSTGGGPGALTLIDSSVTGNSASVTAPNGRFAEGGGIEVQDGEVFTVTNSVVSNNTASLTSSYPSGVHMNANTGGIHVGGFGSATIQGSRITGNLASASDPAGQPAAFDAALAVGLSDFCVCGQTLVLQDSVISGNRTIVTGNGSADGDASGGALEVDGAATITNTAIVGNSTTLSSLTGAATAFGTVLLLDLDSKTIVIKYSVIRGNTVKASTSTGPATIQGAGITNGASLELHNVLVTNNAGIATGTSGFAHGGGIWNAQPFPDVPAPRLALENTLVARNSLNASPGLTVQGGGIYTPGFPIAVIRSVIAHNAPDQCFGC
jgi:hypothetical protein